MPLLAVSGGAGTIVPVERSIAGFRSACAASGNEHLTVEVFEGADNGLRVVAQDGTRQMAPGYLELLGEWAARQAYGDD